MFCSFSKFPVIIYIIDFYDFCSFGEKYVVSFVWFLSVLGARNLDFGFLLVLFWDLWACGKTAESVVRVVNFRGLAPARLSFFTGPDSGGVSVTFFFSFLWFLAVWELSFWELLGLIAVKKEVWKKTQKRSKKWSASDTGKTDSGAVGPFKI